MPPETEKIFSECIFDSKQSHQNVSKIFIIRFSKE